MFVLYEKQKSTCNVIFGNFHMHQLEQLRRYNEDAPHEPLTIITGNRDYTEFEKEFKKRYPEINLEFISYKGKNATEYLNRLFESGDIPDICTQDVLPDAELQKKYLIDLSGYDWFGAQFVGYCS